MQENENQEILATENLTVLHPLHEMTMMPENLIHIENSDTIDIYADDEQRKAMFADWALYFTEITNPDNTVINTFFKAKYAPLNEVLNTVRPIMGKYGLSIIQAPFLSSGDPSVKTIVTHKSGALISFPTAVGKAIKQDIQGFGASVSYLRRFGVNAIAGVMGEVDDDGNENAKNAKKEPTKEELELADVRKEIIKASTAQIEKGINSDVVYKVISDKNNGKKNPNSISDIKMAKTILAEIKKLKVEKAEEPIVE